MYFKKKIFLFKTFFLILFFSVVEATAKFSLESTNLELQEGKMSKVEKILYLFFSLFLSLSFSLSRIEKAFDCRTRASRRMLTHVLPPSSSHVRSSLFRWHCARAQEPRRLGTGVKGGNRPEGVCWGWLRGAHTIDIATKVHGASEPRQPPPSRRRCCRLPAASFADLVLYL